MYFPLREKSKVLGTHCCVVCMLGSAQFSKICTTRTHAASFTSALAHHTSSLAASDGNKLKCCLVIIGAVVTSWLSVYVCVAFEDIAISAELSCAFSWADTSSMAELSEAILSARSCTGQGKSLTFYPAIHCRIGI